MKKLNFVSIKGQWKAFMNNQSKEEKYGLLEAELRALISRKDALVSSMSNFAAAVQSHFGFLWTGFYLVEGNELVLGPFQGPVACTKIAFDRESVERPGLVKKQFWSKMYISSLTTLRAVVIRIVKLLFPFWIKEVK